MTLNGRPSSKDRRTDARDNARLIGDATTRRARGRRRLWSCGVAVALLVIVAATLALTVRPTPVGPRNMASDGVLLGADDSGIVAAQTVALPAGDDPVATDPATLAHLVTITLYVDYLCPYCGQFDAANAAHIASWVAAGNAAVEIHPLAIMDNSSAGRSYSTRAANAAACVADSAPNSFLAVNSALFAAQPDKKATGLTDAELLSVLQSAGVHSTAVTDCVTDQTFASWVGTATDRALAGPLPNADVTSVTGTPTVLVNGVRYEGDLDDPATFEKFVLTMTMNPDDDEIALAEPPAAATAAAQTAAEAAAQAAAGPAQPPVTE